MKTDLDALMEEAGLDALHIGGSGAHNPALMYFTDGAHLTDAVLIKKRGEEPILLHASMERDEAARTGYRTKNLNEFNLGKLLKESNGDTIEASARLKQMIFESLEVRGRVGLYGQGDTGVAYAMLRRLEDLMPGIELVGEPARESVLMRARVTKDAEEVEHIRKVGQISTEVVGRVAEFLRTSRTDGDRLVDGEGSPVTVGDVKRRVHLWLAELGAENRDGMIFATGRDAGIPHSTGKDGDPLRLGVPIIFDLYPASVSNGYFHDFTRTWCLGYAPEEVEAVYADVLEAYESAYARLETGASCRDLQILVCDAFEARGHPTIKTDPKTQEGYVHSLGHGIGLAVHEAPSFSHLEVNTDTLAPGSVITLEPGLYYPDRDMGVRIEDTVWVRPDGGIETLIEYPKDLVLELSGG